MNSIREIRRSTLYAIAALNITSDPKPIRRLALQNFCSLLLPMGLVTAAVLIAFEVRYEKLSHQSSIATTPAQRLDIVSTEAMMLDPSKQLLPAIEPPVLHAAAQESISDENVPPPWAMTPPPVPEISTMHSAAPMKPESSRGVFLTTSSTADNDFLKDTMDRLSAYSNPALVIDVKGSHVYFRSGAPMATEMQLVKPLYDLPSIVDEAHRRGFRIIGRYIALKDPSLALRKSETQIRHPLKSRSVGNVWVDGQHATTLQYNREILEDLVQSGIDEINLDYIRYPTEYAQSDIGLSGSERAKHVTAFVRMAREVISSSGRDVQLGISTYAILGWNFPLNFESVGQDIPELADIVDVISPMAYPSTFSIHAYYDPARDKGSRMYHLVKRTLLGYRELVGPENVHKLRPWIQGYGVTEKNMNDQIQAVFDAELCGFTVWSASNAYGPTYKAMKKMTVPERCS